MLKLKICPKCGTEFKAGFRFFCYNCGARLKDGSPPPKGTGALEEVEVSLPPKAQGAPRFGWKKLTAWAVFFLVISLLTAAAFVFYRRSRLVFHPQPPELPKSAPATGWEGKLFDLPQITFAEESLASVVPYGVDFYLEASQPQFLLAEVFSASQSALFKERVGLSSTEAAALLKPRFGLVRQGSASAFLAKVRSADAVGSKIEEAGSVGGFEGRLIGDCLVVANSENLFALLGAVRERTVRSLRQDPLFDQAWRSLPPRGQIFLFGRSDKQSFLPEEFWDGKGDYRGFVIDRRGGLTVVYKGP